MADDGSPVADDGSPITDGGSPIAPGLVQAPPGTGGTSSTTTSCIVTIVTILAVLGFGVPDGFTVDKSLLNSLAGSVSSAPVATGNTAIVNPAPQFPLPSPAESPSPSPLPTQDVPTPDSGGGGSTGGGHPTTPPPAGCTPVVPSSAQITDSQGTHTTSSNGTFTAHGPAGQPISATVSGAKACNGNHIALTIRDAANNSSCNLTMSGSITVSISAFNGPTDAVSITTVNGSGC